jgi:hypothetical protein
VQQERIDVGTQLGDELDALRYQAADEANVASSAEAISRRQRTPPIGPRSWQRYSASSPKGDKALVGNTGYRRYLTTLSRSMAK